MDRYRIVDMRETTDTRQGFAIWDEAQREFTAVSTAYVFDGEEFFRGACHNDGQEYTVDGFESAVCALLPSWARA